MAATCAIAYTPATLFAQGAKKAPGKASADAVALTWPLPPEQPRIRYVTTYRGVDAFKPAKKPSRFVAALLGARDAGDKPSDMMVKPYGVAVSPSGRVYVTDTAARRVFAFDPDLQTVGFIGEEGSTRLSKPVGVAVDADGRVFVADATSKRVFGFSPGGQLLIAIGRDGEFDSPSGLAIDRLNHRVYVADAAKHQIFSYSTDTGALLGLLGSRGSEPGSFNFPTNLCVDRAGHLYVADTLNFRIQVFDADGKFLKAFGELGDGPGYLNRPKGIGVDSQGHVYVVDSSFSNFQIFDTDGQLLLFVGTGGQSAGQFVLPAGLYIDERDRIYIADQGNSRVQIFQFVRADAGGGAVRGGASK
jgi:sugar lactone lactonase YvrE